VLSLPSERQRLPRGGRPFPPPLLSPLPCLCVPPARGMYHCGAARCTTHRPRGCHRSPFVPFGPLFYTLKTIHTHFPVSGSPIRCTQLMGHCNLPLSLGSIIVPLFIQTPPFCPHVRRLAPHALVWCPCGRSIPSSPGEPSVPLRQRCVPSVASTRSHAPSDGVCSPPHSVACQGNGLFSSAVFQFTLSFPRL